MDQERINPSLDHKTLDQMAIDGDGDSPASALQELLEMAPLEIPDAPSSEEILDELRADRF